MIFFIPEQKERMKGKNLSSISLYLLGKLKCHQSPPFSKYIDNSSSLILLFLAHVYLFSCNPSHSSHYSLQAIRRCSFSFFLKVKALLPHSLTINHLQMTFGVIFIRFMIIMRDISKAICGIL